MAAASVTILDDSYLCGDAFAHGVGVADDAHLLALRILEHSQRIDDRGECIGI